MPYIAWWSASIGAVGASANFDSRELEIDRVFRNEGILCNVKRAPIASCRVT